MEKHPLDMTPMSFPDFKAISEQDIDKILSKDVFKGHKPYPHQKNTIAAGLYHVLNHGCWPNFSDMGTGKSFSYAIVLRNLIDLGDYPVKRVLCIGSSNFLGNNNARLYPNGLAGELRRWGGLDVEVVSQPQSVGRSTVQGEGIFLTNWESLWRLYPNQAAVSEYGVWDVLIFDEAHKAAKTDTKTHKIVYALSCLAEYVIGGTGTVLADKPQDAFGVLRIIDGGETFGNNRQYFLQKYFTKFYYLSGLCPHCGKFLRYKVRDDQSPEKTCFYCKNLVNGWKLPRGRKFTKYEFKESKKADFIKRIYARSIVYMMDELENMPKEIITVQQVSMTKEQKTVYDQTLKNYMINNKEYSQSAMRTKLAQITGGFTKDGKDEVRWKVKVKENPKLQVLNEFADEYSGKIVVFTHFKQEVELIKELLKQRKEKYVEVHGDISRKKRDEAEAKFTNDDKIRWFIGTMAACKEGLNLWRASVTFYYSLSEWLLDFTQSSKRTKRPQQKEDHVRIIILETSNSVDITYTQNVLGKKEIVDNLSAQEFYKQMRGEI